MDMCQQSERRPPLKIKLNRDQGELTVKATILRLFLFWLLVSSVVQAAVPWTPPTENLPADKLSPLLEAWDGALANRNFDDFEHIVGSITAMVPEGQRFSKTSVIRYDNPEIIDRVVDYFLAMSERLKNGSQFFPEEYAEGYSSHITTLAESTFDSRIYENRLRDDRAEGSRMRNVYLATVNPTRTLDFLFESKTGDRSPRANNGRGGSPEFLYHQGEFRWSMPIDRAFTVLADMIAQSPHALEDARERTIAFAAEHARHFSQPPLDASHSAMLVYYEGYDYYVRYDALDLLEFLGTVTEVPLVEEIIRDAPYVDLSEMRGGFGRLLDRYEQIQDKGLRIIEILRQRSPSQR